MKDLNAFLQKKYLSEYRYLVDELVYSRALFDDYNKIFKKDFASDIADNIKARGKTHKVSTDPSSIDVTPNETEKEHSMPLLKRLYKRLVLLCHPDKTSGDSMIFQKVEHAYRKGDVIGLLDTARSLNIDIYDDMTEKDVDLTAAMKRSIMIMKNDIDQITQSLAWVWCTATAGDRPRLRVIISASIRSC